MSTVFRATASAVFSVMVLVLPATLRAAAQDPQSPPDLAVSLDRIREELANPPATQLKLDVQLPVATFRTEVEQRVWVPTLHEWLQKEFKLNTFGRQSAAWAGWSGGSGVVLFHVRLDAVLAQLEKTLERRKLRKIREQIARELAELEAARQKEQR